MSWNDIMNAASKTVIDSFGQRARVDDYIWCNVVIDVIPRTSGSTYEPVIADYPVAIFLRSDIEDEEGNGLEVGIQIDMVDGDSYQIEAVCEEKTNKYHVAYWINKVDE